jgi:hypothetical protein
LLVARDTSLGLIPIDVTENIIDVIADPELIDTLRLEAIKALENKDIVTARNLIDDLVSEVQINTTSIPLATFPTGIKAIAPLIDEGKIEEAKLGIKNLLSTLVVTKTTIPLPTTRALAMLVEAETLAENKERTDDQDKELNNLLHNASEQLKLGEALGYGDSVLYSALQKQIEEIESKVNSKNSGKGWFDKIKEKISSTF